MNSMTKQLKPLLAILLSLLLATMHNPVNAKDHSDPAEGEKVERRHRVHAPNLWIVKDGKHSSVILRTVDAQPRLPLAEASTARGPFVMLGWGDAAYYQAADKSLELTLKALFVPTRAALNARSLRTLNDAPQTQAKAKLYPLTLNADDLQNVLRRIGATLDSQGATAADGSLVGVDNPYVGGRFYPAFDRRYSLLFTCNNWVADVLKAGGMHFSTLSAQTAGNLVLQHKVQWLVSSRYRERTQFSAIAVTKLD